MESILLVATIIIGVLIILLTLFQGKGGGLGSAWGGAGGGFQTRRGLEKWMLRITAILVFIFFAISVIKLLI
ncbi:preprotein translocase subunit SecG [Candidatus Roizmanbacteria bacterium RIFCSPLOWO2_02_FULL_37_19]|uniref:Protein-export membrane protein SecG n=1 Tax=Candidatus Roizmanbacteria bacterium RIFCSPHIGHO2_02_FULL_37_24 TaxID=1802037 RepID=A0A1F7GYH7_9BACT|nr:MAG: preprotein translocase subunit SecG [Candidatus Roizmanbacteria bacterium RIFCSPHIGHO2_01_FULL_38_41]OGK23572.1 MAG: preprotein translocase subunit SecG [Candidatus Roizmanbacteria bacterium RIFCSPHIGHO2_02_FULL_37_24]OGK33279.1 MAG: preprotein translocase subunit SecG [Candidatus Roizmanbacteria bacterium RIFCSPHIGHO2_12_FULL_37_23]OGK43350.1 MAG: preprotein translocase subunit SecG [Candidatus Roizmanbacteria bacterium RIFCSPLOWO2_01_FULL_37_57]OGK53692.1 MAG: preprotein translocase s